MPEKSNPLHVPVEFQRSEHLSVGTCHNQPNFLEILFDIIPCFQQSVQIFAWLKCSKEQNVLRWQIITVLICTGMKNLLIHAIGCHDHIVSIKSLIDLPLHIMRWRENHAHTSGENRQKQMVPGGETPSEPMRMFQRTQIMDGQRLISNHQWTCICRRPQYGARTYLPRQNELLPDMTR